jgi:hypothetical protein
MVRNIGTFLRSKWRPALLYLASYLLWAGLSVLAMFLLFQLRINLLDFLFLLGASPEVATIIHQLTMLMLGILAIGFIVVLEHYLSKGVAKNELWRRAGGILFILLVMLGLSYGFQYVLAPAPW